MVDCIHPKPVDAPVKPESQHFAHGLLHFWIAPIEVRLLLQVRVVVVLAGRFVECPSRTAKLALPVVRRGTVRLRVSPDIPVPLSIEPRGAALLKPGMLTGGVVRHEIKNDLEAACVRGLKERVEVGEGKIGEIQTASISSRTRCSRRREIPLRSPTPSPSESWNDRGYTW
jgi:hypothetical protein